MWGADLDCLVSPPDHLRAQGGGTKGRGRREERDAKERFRDGERGDERGVGGRRRGRKRGERDERGEGVRL